MKPCERLESTNLGDFNDIKQKSEHMTLMFKVDGPGNEGTMVGGCPGVGRKVDFAGVLGEDFGDAITAEVERRLNIASDGP